MACFLYASSMAVQPDYCWISCTLLPALSASTFAPGHQTWPYTAPAHHAAAKLKKNNQKNPTQNKSLKLQMQKHVAYLTTCMSANNRGVSALTLTTVPAKTPCYISGLDCPFLTGLQKNKQSLQLVRDTGDWILLRLFKLPAETCQRN